MRYDTAVHAEAEGRSAEALALLDEALGGRPGPSLRALIHQARARIGVSDAPMRTHELLLTEAAAIEAVNPRLAVAMRTAAAGAALWAGESELAAEASSGARELALRTPEPIPQSLYLFDLIFSANAAERARGVRSVLEETAVTDACDVTQIWEHGVVLFWLEDYANARRLLEAAVTRARGGDGRALLPVALDTLAMVDFHTGWWAAADGRAAEALRLARDRGQAAQAASCLTTLARIAAARGHEQECRKHLAHARELVPAGHLVSAYAASAAALLELGLSRPEVAIEELLSLRLREAEQSPPAPMVVQWPPDLIEAYVRAGRLDDARATLRRFELNAAGSGIGWALAAAARCRGLLSETDAFDSEFATALHWHGRTPTPFERARTELCFGERLRRVRRRSEAVAVLRSALTTFERLGATPWAERARRELATKRRRGATKPSEDVTLLLTSRELQVASLIGRGATNREAASALFVTPKTIEYHLAGIYRKLNVRSRSELTYLLSESRRRPQGSVSVT